MRDEHITSMAGAKADDYHGESEVAEPVLERADQRGAGGYPERAESHHEGQGDRGLARPYARAGRTVSS